MKNLFIKLYKFIYSIRHGFCLLGYAVMGLIFQLMEKVNVKVDTWISCSFDSQIPFINVFVIPYILWFWFVFMILAVLVLKDKDGLYKACATIYIGMSISFIVYWIYPHGQPLRVPLTGMEKNVFDRLVYYIYAHDTPTNTLPSIHVLNSMAVNFALQSSPFFKKRIGIRIGSHVINILIIMSTVLIKQHSILDVVAAVILAYIIRFVVYYIDWKQFFIKKPLESNA